MLRIPYTQIPAMTPARKTALALLLLTVPVFGVRAADKLVVVQAESAALSTTPATDYTIGTENGVTFITPATDLLTPATAPGNASKVATYTVTFPQAGTYNLFMRFRIGPGAGNDDSLYYANAFGTREPATAGHWVIANYLASVGFTAAGDAVESGGTSSNLVWKWLRLSSYNGGGSGVTFTVPAGALTQTFQIGSRENGLDVDMIAFGLTSQSFTVANLLDTPPVVLDGQVLTAYEGSGAGTVVGAVLASDPEGDVRQGWAITGGTGAAVFAINATTGQLTVVDPSALVASVNPSFSLTVTTTDGVFTSAPRTVTINVGTLSNIAVYAPPTGLYHAGQALTFTVSLNRPMIVDTTGGTPSIALTVGSAPRQAVYVSGSGTSSLSFAYTVQAGDNDSDGVSAASPIALNGGTIKDDAAAAIGLSFTPPVTAGILVDTAAPNAPAIATYANRTFSGTAEAGSTVRVYLNGTLNTTAAANGAGAWSCPVSPVGIPAGTNNYTATATATDAAGNVSALSAGLPLTIVVDPNAPIIVQAESGSVGSDFLKPTANGVTYITAATDLSTSPNAQSPGLAAKVASYTVYFPQAGTYNLYARVRIGSGSASDDSCYYGNGLGAQTVTDPNAWITCNNLYNVGYTDSTEYVTAQGSVWGAGPAGTGMWKWIQLSTSNFYDAGPQFVVPEGGLLQTFQFGSRENGFDVDQFVFGLNGVYYTVAQLDAASAGSTTPPPPPYTPPGPPLATGKAKFLGCEYGANSAPNFAAYFNQVVPGNGGKWGSIEGSRDVMNWTDFDSAYRIAKTNGFKFRYHVLVWGSQQPTWMESLSDADQLDEIKEWFAAIAAHTVDGEVINPDWIEVVNEPLHAPPNGAGTGNYMKALGGSGTTGWDWILNAFRLARQYFPGKKLMLNEYSVTNDGNSMARYVQIINLLKAENLIDLVGFQGHSFEIKGTPTTTLSANLETLAATGLPIIVTEMDIDDSASLPQLGEYQRIFPLLWEHPSVIGVTLWGYRPGMWRPDANLVLNSGAEKPAMLWLKSYVGDNFPVVTADQTIWVAPGAANGTVVGTVQATDADAGAVLQDWSIKDGSAATAFSINAATGALTLTNAAALNFIANPTYTLRVKVGDGIGHSVATVLTVRQITLPNFTTQPSHRTVLAGASAQFLAAASGTPVPALRWQRSVDAGGTWTDLADGGNYSGTATGALTVTATSVAMSGDLFRCVASNGATPAASNEAALEVIAAIANYSDWAAVNGVTGGASDDPSGSGVSNFARYAFDLAATGPVGAPASISVVAVGAEKRLQIAFTRRASATDLTYVIEASSDLSNWSEQVATVDCGTPVDVFVQDSVALGSVSRRFLRVRALVPVAQ